MDPSPQEEKLGQRQLCKGHGVGGERLVLISLSGVAHYGQEVSPLSQG